MNPLKDIASVATASFEGTGTNLTSSVDIIGDRILHDIHKTEIKVKTPAQIANAIYIAFVSFTLTAPSYLHCCVPEEPAARHFHWDRFSRA